MSKESALAVATGNPTTTVPPIASPDAAATPPAPPTQLQSTPFSHLAKKEAELVRQRQEFKKREEQFQTEQKQVQAFQAKIKEYEALKAKDPVAALKFIDFNETDLFNYIAANQKPELTAEEKAAQAALEATNKKIKEWEDSQTKKEQEFRVAQDNQVLQEFRGTLAQTIEKNKDKYEYCNYYGKDAQDLAYEITKEVWKTEKEVLLPHEAIEMAENYFDMRDAEMMAIKKRQNKFKPQTPAPVKTEPQRSRTLSPPNPSQSQSKPATLTNNATATIASTRTKFNESREQKRERLMQALRDGKL